MHRFAAALLAIGLVLLIGCAGPAQSPVAPAAVAPTLIPATSTTSPLPTPTATPTATPEPAPVRFAVIGDYGLAGEPARDVAALIKSWQPEFIITLGDNNYPHGAAATIDQNVGQYYHEYIAPYTGTYGAGAATNRFFPTLGNHDWETSGAAPYLDYFTLPGNERYYAFTWGPLRLFALDSALDEPDGVRAGSIQAGWLQQELAASTACWNLVYMHHAPFSSGDHGSSEWMRWPYQSWGADAVLAGHDHHYERLILDGLPYFVNGLGGGARYRLGSPQPGSEVRYNAEVGAMLVEATPVELTFQFVTRSGEVVDTYRLRQEAGGC
jgi:tartrate-resistant acid phosphatase type 5